MNKILKHKKEEKRLVRLLYKKGLLKDFKLKDLYWNAYSILRTKKRKHGRKHKSTVYLPEVHFCKTDYWGESDEYSIASHIYHNFEYSINYGDFESPIIIRYSRIQRIKMLQKLPTVVNNNKIRKVLQCKIDE